VILPKLVIRVGGAVELTKIINRQGGVEQLCIVCNVVDASKVPVGLYAMNLYRCPTSRYVDAVPPEGGFIIVVGSALPVFGMNSSI